MKIIVFDENATTWTKNVDYNLGFLQHQANYIKELFSRRGYIYLNQIYEHFGIEWNPGLVSPCYLLKSGQINFMFEPVRDVAILVKIDR